MPTSNDTTIKLIEQVEEALAQLKADLKGSPVPEADPERGARVLAEVIRRGGSVGRGELYAIAKEVGMDKRGLGGLFRQTGKTLLHVLPGDRIVLTPEGSERGQRYLNLQRSSSSEYETAEPAMARIAEPSFAEDWDSEEDAAYDQL